VKSPWVLADSGTTLPLDHLDEDPGAIQGRFEGARRAGTPEWLWPEVGVDAWRTGLKAIELVTREILNGERKQVLQGEAQPLCLAAYSSGMGPLLGYWVEQGTLEAEAHVAALLELHLRHNRMRMERLRGVAREITSRMLLAGLDPTLLKGIQTAHSYFPEPGTRPMSDIDLLLPVDQVGEAERVLESFGYQRVAVRPAIHSTTWRPVGQAPLPRSLWLTHSEDPISLDLHRTLDREFVGGPMLRLDRVAGRVSDRPQSTIVPGRELAQPLLALHLATHASALHSLTLIRLVEFVLHIRRDIELRKLDWADFVSVSQAAGASRFAYPALELAERLAPGTVPDEVLVRFRAAATPRTRRIVSRLTPAETPRLDGRSLSEQFMWAGSARELIVSVADSVRRAARWYSPSEVAAISIQKGWRLLKGSLRR
jgi:hypothetical protein